VLWGTSQSESAVSPQQPAWDYLPSGKKFLKLPALQRASSKLLEPVYPSVSTDPTSKSASHLLTIPITRQSITNSK
jgi:hypothetical protein